MTDRQPGAPGQYIMTIDASVAQNILIGQPVTVTLTRDDQPLVEGTPYNKASVLPDELAARICPSVSDPTPADAFNGLSKKKFAITLLATGWTESYGIYTQRIPLSAVLGDDDESIKSWPVYSGDKVTDEALRDAVALVTYAKSSAGAVTFTCIDEAPTVDIPVIVEVSR